MDTEDERAQFRADVKRGRIIQNAQRVYDLLFALRTVVPPSHPLASELRAIIAEIET